MSQKGPRDWRELCRQAAEEPDPEKLMDLIVELNRALDEHNKKRKGAFENTRDKEQSSRSSAMDSLTLGCNSVRSRAA
jgi:hypothetical protein